MKSFINKETGRMVWLYDYEANYLDRYDNVAVIDTNHEHTMMPTWQFKKLVGLTVSKALVTTQSKDGQ